MTVQEKRTSSDAFEVFLAHPDNAERLFELIDGEIVEKVPTEEHSLVVGNLYFALRRFVEERDLGRVAFEVRRRVPHDTHNSRLPDAEFTRKERVLPVVTQGAVPQMPDLAIEVKSPNDSFKKLRDKAAYYLANGTRVVWLVYPAQRIITVLTADSEDILGIDDTLDGGDVLPGFRMAVKDVFKL
jgi:Uma2 family endonuclease